MNTVYTDDPEASWTFTVKDNNGSTLDWSPVNAAAGNDTYTLTATWQGTAPTASATEATTRKVKVSLDTLPVGNFTLYLKVPSGNDLQLGTVAVRDRS